MDDIVFLAIGAAVGFGILYPAIQFFVLMPLQRRDHERRLIEMEIAMKEAIAAMPPAEPIKLVINLDKEKL